MSFLINSPHTILVELTLEIVWHDTGVLLQNVFDSSARVVRTMQYVFGDLALLDTGYSNKILIAFKQHNAAVQRDDAISRALFLRSMKLGPKCFDHGLRHGQTDDLVSIFENRYSLAYLPLLEADVIRDSDPEVQELERKRWAFGAPDPSVISVT